MDYVADDTEVLEGPSAEARLKTLGLKHEWLVRAVLAAAMERRNCSLLEPSNAPGFKMWAKGFGTLAEELVPFDWRKVETHGLPRMVNAKTAVAVALVSGDDATGIFGREPKSKTRRGQQSKLLVRSNQRQSSLPFMEPGLLPTPAAEEQITWWLLIHSGQGGLRAELSLPVGVGEDSKLSVWKTRIILDIPQDEFEKVDRGDTEPPLEIDVPVRPR